MCIKKAFAVLFFLSSILVAFFAGPSVFELGGKNGWGMLQYTENIQMRSGKYGNPGISLRSSIPKITQATDLYLSFDSPSIIEETSSYTVLSSNMRFAGAEQAKFGSGAAVCSPHAKTAGLVLKPLEGSFFAGEGSAGSFTVEFWIAPAVAESGSVMLQWYSAYFEKEHLTDQHIIAQIIQNKLQWDFFNIWQDKYNNGISIQLRGRSNLIPSQWSHHLITYDEEIGLLEYRMNGHTENIVYVTENGREGDSILMSRLGHAADLSVGVHYSGMIDELKVTKQFVEPPTFAEQAALFDRYHLNGGRFESLILDSGGALSEAKKVSISVDVPTQTEAVFFIRSGEDRYAWTDEEPAWKPVRNGQPITGMQGRFFQIAGNLYPDADGQKTPIVHSIQFEYEKDTEPLPPARVFAAPKDGSIELSWAPSIDFDVKGYMVYYGERKGEYFSAGSPVNVGKTLSYRVSNLDNGKIYFFTVAAYDDEKGERVGSFSQEIWARPRKE